MPLERLSWRVYSFPVPLLANYCSTGGGRRARRALGFRAIRSLSLHHGEALQRIGVQQAVIFSDNQDPREVAMMQH
jgi:hypothetical protein